MLSRSIDTRAIYVIGVPTLLALSESVFPAYFTDLPRPLQNITSSPLALSLGAALVLSLFFRLGTRQIAATDWNHSDASINAAIAFLRDKMKGWKVNAALIDTSTEHAGKVLDYIIKHHSHRLEGVARGLFNGLELRIEIRYRGSPNVHLPVVRHMPAPIGGEIDDEEAAAYIGLRNFLRSLTVDRQQIKAGKTGIVVRLFYAV